ncbi:MAG: DUF2806 domain-containing protein [Caldilineaceae bacterium SB0668_bin_21]|nr:DUF2806 domain-containing protein [Caldilineaceae bacterium SB0668_bin_21]MYC22892.1 DUF2806 domain-containing protein [Caldilineaceae bacterium SB0662_bin_25]
MLEHISKILATEKLLDYLASGIGATAGPIFRPWQAYMEGHAKRISARADADALAIIAEAQADARQYLIAPGADVQGAVEITHENIMQRIEFQERKRLANIRSVVESAAEELGEKEVVDHEPDHDWTARFFDCVQDVSSEHMQKLWAKVLSGEVESPGRTSLRTLDTLRNMTKRDAELFDEFAGYVIGGKFVFNDDHFVQRLGAMKPKYLLHLQDCGLVIIAPFLRWTGTFGDGERSFFLYQGGALLIEKEKGASDKLEIPIVSLTAAGKELFQIVQGSVQKAYLQDFATFLQNRGCQLYLVDEVVNLPEGGFNYTSCELIEPRPIQSGMPTL